MVRLWTYRKPVRIPETGRFEQHNMFSYTTLTRLRRSQKKIFFKNLHIFPNWFWVLDVVFIILSFVVVCLYTYVLVHLLL